jgi:hypothetical protein
MSESLACWLLYSAFMIVFISAMLSLNNYWSAESRDILASFWKRLSKVLAHSSMVMRSSGVEESLQALYSSNRLTSA